MAKTIRVYPAYIKGESNEVILVDEQFLMIWAALGTSKTQAINQIFMAGLETLMKSKELECQGDKAGFQMLRKVQQVNSGLAKQGNLEFLYGHLPLDEFVEFCQGVNVDADAFLSMYRAAPPSPEAKRKVVLDGLKQVLADGAAHSIDDIQGVLVEGGIIVDEDWAYVRNVASQEGYSRNAKRGYWKITR